MACPPTSLQDTESSTASPLAISWGFMAISVYGPVGVGSSVGCGVAV